MKKVILYSMLLLAAAGDNHAQTNDVQTPEKHLMTKKQIRKQAQNPKEVKDVFLIVDPDERIKKWHVYFYNLDLALDQQALDSADYNLTYEFPEWEETEILGKEGKQHCFFSRKSKRIYSNTSVVKDQLPDIIMDAFDAGCCKDWHIIEKREFILFSEPDIHVYAIRAKKEKVQHVLYYAEKNGRLLQIRKIRN